MIKEMAFIKDSKPYIEELLIIKDKIFQLKGEKFEAGKGLGDIKEKSKELK